MESRREEPVVGGDAPPDRPDAAARPSPPWRLAYTVRPAHPLVYALGRTLARLALRIFVPLDVDGLANVPAAGPVIAVANHLTFLDPPVLVAVLPRRVSFLARDDLFQKLWLAVPLRLMGALPVRRAARDVASLRAALALLGRGEAVGVFPEGTRSRRRGLLRANPGVALLVVRSEAPVLPIAVTGVDELESVGRFLTARSRGRRIRVAIGPPFRPDPGPRPDHQAIADAVMRRVADLLPPEYRGFYHEPGPAAADDRRGDPPAAEER